MNILDLHFPLWSSFLMKYCVNVIAKERHSLPHLTGGFCCRILHPAHLFSSDLSSSSLFTILISVSFLTHFTQLTHVFRLQLRQPTTRVCCLLLPVLRFRLIVAFPSVRKDRSSLSLQFFCRHSIARRRFLMKARTVNAYFENYVFSLFLLFITSLFYNESGVFQVVSEQRKEGG